MHLALPASLWCSPDMGPASGRNHAVPALVAGGGPCAEHACSGPSRVGG